MVLVTFRESDNKLTALFSEKFATVKKAKSFIEKDAKQWIKAHGLDKENA